MAASIAVTNLNHYGTATITVSGDTATTARTLQVTSPNGATETYSFTTSGAGGVTLSFTPSESGSHTFTLYSVAAQVATKTMNTSHE